MSSQIPRRDLEDRLSHYGVSVDGSWWNFQESIFIMLFNIWHHQKSCQECPSSSRLQEETWRTGWVLMGFLLLHPDKIFRKASLLYSLTSDTIIKVVRNVHVLPDSKKRLGLQDESWWGFCWWILMKFSGKHLYYTLYHLTPSKKLSGTSMSS